MHHQGIFRVSGSVSEMCNYKALFENGENLRLFEDFMGGFEDFMGIFEDFMGIFGDFMGFFWGFHGDF